MTDLSWLNSKSILHAICRDIFSNRNLRTSSSASANLSNELQALAKHLPKLIQWTDCAVFMVGDPTRTLMVSWRSQLLLFFWFYSYFLSLLPILELEAT